MAEGGIKKGSEEDVYDDPRCFRFQLLCLNCAFYTNNLKGLKIHLKNECPYKDIEPYNLLCGHYEFRTKVWASFARHINTKDLQFASPLNEMYA